jgi:hypothetical protein
MVYFELRLWDDAANTEVVYRETTTTLKVRKGWNYLAFHLDEIYEYSYLTIYHRSEEHIGTYDKYESLLKGYYYKDFNDNSKPDRDSVVVLGCKTYTNWPAPSTWTSATVFPDPVYGLCMTGWIHTIEIWAADGNWDTIFNAD